VFTIVFAIFTADSPINAAACNPLDSSPKDANNLIPPLILSKVEFRIANSASATAFCASIFLAAKSAASLSACSCIFFNSAAFVLASAIS
jgi:hypothetical protein